MAVISPVEAAGFIPEIWLGTALGRLRNYLTLSRTVTMHSDLETGESFTKGKVLHIPKRGTLTANAKSDTGNYTVQNPQSSTVDVVLSQQTDVTFALTSQTIAFQNQPEEVGYVEDALIAIAEQIDTYLFGLWRLIASANKIDNHSATITEANILSARKILRDNKISPMAEAFGVISTAQEAAVLQLANLVRYDALGVAGGVAGAKIGDPDSPVRIPGAIGKAYGFEIAPSQLVPSVSANDNTLQTITEGAGNTGGSFTLTVGGQTTDPIAQAASAAKVQAALGALSTVGVGNVFVSGAAGGPYTVAFLANAAAITATANLTGGTNTVTIAQVAQDTGAKNLFYTKDAIVLATRPLPLPDPGTGAVGAVMTDPATGITMRLVKSWNPNMGSPQITLDVLYGANLMRSEHAVLLETN